MKSVTVVCASARVGILELRTIYTVPAFISTVILRVVFMAIFFGMTAKWLGGGDFAEYVLLGNCVAVIVVETMQATSTAVLEQTRGTLPYLLASKSRVGIVFLTRGFHWLVTGVATSVSLLLLVALHGDAQWSVADAAKMIPILLLVSLSSYFLGVVMGSISIQFVKARGIIASTSFFALAAFTGVNVPVETWPAPVQILGDLLPLRWGLAAVRSVSDSAPVGDVLQFSLYEALVAAGWATAAFLCMNGLVERARKNGTLDISV
ncbi:ABC transporter permease [Nocardia sp. NPDC051929]|uniref:ABC transporter permease n=1 Tax=Nocardia sp. NPDC051929 TaxID=3364327 RepID=UPI0037C69AD2